MIYGDDNIHDAMEKIAASKGFLKRLVVEGTASPRQLKSLEILAKRKFSHQQQRLSLRLMKTMGLDHRSGDGLKLWNHYGGKNVARNLSTVSKEMPKGWKLQGIGNTRRGTQSGYTYSGTQAKGPGGKVVEDLGTYNPENLERAMGKDLSVAGRDAWDSAKMQLKDTKALPIGSKNRRSWLKGNR